MLSVLVGAALASFLTAPPAMGAGVVKLEGLSVQSRMTLPAATRVSFRGRELTIGVLKAEHVARLQRFANAASLGKTYRIKPGTSSSVGQRAKVAVPTTAPGTQIIKAVVSTPTPRPIDLSKLELAMQVVAPLQNLAIDFTPAKDYVDFCTAAAAAACLYLPASTTLVPTTTSFAEADLLIADPGVCAGMGGTFDSFGKWCLFQYPRVFLGNFVPGSAAKGPTTFSTNCPPTVDVKTDPKGAIKMTIQASDYLVATGTSISLCVVNASTPI